MKLYNMLAGGIWSPHIHRFFEGKRQGWTGARGAIENVNRVDAESKKVRCI